MVLSAGKSAGVALLVSLIALPSYSYVVSDTLPALADSVVHDNFEGYNGIVPLAYWPQCGGFLINGFGDPEVGFFPNCDPEFKCDGDFSLKQAFFKEHRNTGDIMAQGHLMQSCPVSIASPHPNYSAYQGYRLWLKPSGTSGVFHFDWATANAGCAHHFCEDYPVKDTAAVFITAPWANCGGMQASDISSICEPAMWLNNVTKGDKGAYYVDQILAVKFKKPLTQMVVTPAAKVLKPAPAETLTAPVRINCGWPRNLTDAGGKTWRRDQFYTGYSCGDYTLVWNYGISGSLDSMYKSLNQCMRSYDFLLRQNGEYKVTLHFAEIAKMTWDPVQSSSATATQVTAAGQRVFSVKVQSTSIPDIDVYAGAGGGGKPLVKTATVSVTDHKLRIEFVPSKNLPIVNGIEVELVTPASVLDRFPGSCYRAGNLAGRFAGKSGSSAVMYDICGRTVSAEATSLSPGLYQVRAGTSKPGDAAGKQLVVN